MSSRVCICLGTPGSVTLSFRDIKERKFINVEILSLIP